MRRPEWECWSDLRFTLRPLPWTWRLAPDLYADGVDGVRGHWSFRWLFLTVEWWGPRRDEPMFPMRDPVAAAGEQTPDDPEG